MTIILRWSLTIALLVTIARHVHWSVTLAFVLIFVHAEITAYLIVKLRRQVSPGAGLAEAFRLARKARRKA